MYVFIPEYFLVEEFYTQDVKIFAQTYLSKGARFFSNQGRWIFLQNCAGYIYGDQMHWLHILYLYSNKKQNKNTEFVSNVLVFKQNSHLILEVINQIKYGTLIYATFHNISAEDLIYITETNNKKFNIIASIEKPLDLSRASGQADQLEKKISIRRKQMLPCDLCNKEFDRPSLLKRHIRTHTGERPHICEVCGKGFSTSSSLNTHKRIHSGERPHQCGLCGKRFTASSNLYYHRLTHSTEKPHKCDICGKSFPTPGNLRSHKYSHGGVSPYKCAICFRVFTKQTNLKNHVNLHKNK